MTVLEVITRSAEFLAKKGVESPRLQSELLLGHVLGIPRLKLYLQFERKLTPEEQDKLREMIRRRGLREPLQHIIGSVSFCGHEFRVNKDVLIPRPETELLAEKAWLFLNAHASPTPKFLELGTGSGCIAISLAKECEKCSGVALDISEPALAVARQNAEANGCADRISFVQSNAFAALLPDAKFDLIVSNPPYIPTAEVETLQPEVRQFDPRAALDGGKDGLDFYRILAEEGRGFLNPGGKLMVEFGDGQETVLPALFQAQNWIVEKIEPDYSGRMRILVAAFSGQ